MQFIKSNMKKLIADEKLTGGAPEATKILSTRWAAMNDEEKKP